MTEAEPHATTIELKEPPPLEVPVGATFVVKVAVTCVNGCDLHEQRLAIAAPAGAGEAQQSASEDPEIGEFHEIAMRAPPRVGEHVWRIALAQASDVRPRGGAARDQCQREAAGHEPRGLGHPVAGGDRGRHSRSRPAQSRRAISSLTGRTIEACDETGAVLAQGRLGDAPWPGTSALYWTELRLAAPDQEGACVVGALRRCRCRASA